MMLPQLLQLLILDFPFSLILSPRRARRRQHLAQKSKLNCQQGSDRWCKRGKYSKMMRMRWNGGECGPLDIHAPSERERPLSSNPLMSGRPSTLWNLFIFWGRPEIQTSKICLSLPKNKAAAPYSKCFSIAGLDSAHRIPVRNLCSRWEMANVSGISFYLYS